MHRIKTLTKRSTMNLSLDELIQTLKPHPAWMGQLPSLRREQRCFAYLSYYLWCDDQVAPRQSIAVDLETDQATVLGAQLDQPRGHEARVAR